MIIESDDGYKFSEHDLKTIEIIAKADQETLQRWEYRLKEAQEKVEYWKHQVAATTSLSTRANIMFHKNT